MSGPIRVVFDCNVFFQSLISPFGPAGACLDAVRQDKLLLFVSRQVFDELRHVCLRPAIATRFRLTEARVDAFVMAVEKLGAFVDVIPHVFDYERDPDDAHYVDLAVAANARLIVSRDNDLLALSNADDPAGADFQRRFPGLEILTPEAVLSRLKEGEDDSSRST
jgi:putative PIN family toxin of toxin-antitoxin system